MNVWPDNSVDERDKESKGSETDHQDDALPQLHMAVNQTVCCLSGSVTSNEGNVWKARWNVLHFLGGHFEWMHQKSNYKEPINKFSSSVTVDQSSAEHLQSLWNRVSDHHSAVIDPSGTYDSFAKHCACIYIGNSKQLIRFNARCIEFLKYGREHYTWSNTWEYNETKSNKFIQFGNFPLKRASLRDHLCSHNICYLWVQCFQASDTLVMHASMNSDPRHWVRRKMQSQNIARDSHFQETSLKLVHPN